MKPRRWRTIRKSLPEVVTFGPHHGGLEDVPRRDSQVHSQARTTLNDFQERKRQGVELKLSVLGQW